MTGCHYFTNWLFCSLKLSKLHFDFLGTLNCVKPLWWLPVFNIEDYFNGSFMLKQLHPWWGVGNSFNDSDISHTALAIWMCVTCFHALFPQIRCQGFPKEPEALYWYQFSIPYSPNSGWSLFFIQRKKNWQTVTTGRDWTPCSWPIRKQFNPLQTLQRKIVQNSACIAISIKFTSNSGWIPISIQICFVEKIHSSDIEMKKNGRKKNYGKVKGF